jgi:hypothetical protein
MVSVLGKLHDLESFRNAVVNFNILPKKVVSAAVFLFIGAEACVVMFLLIGRDLLTSGFILAVLLLVIFSIAIYSVLHRRIQTRCNCFGADSTLVSAVDLYRNGILIFICLAGLVSLQAVDTMTTLSIVEYGLIALIAAVFLLILLNMRDIITLFK